MYVQNVLTADNFVIFYLKTTLQRSYMNKKHTKNTEPLKALLLCIRLEHTHKPSSGWSITLEKHAVVQLFKEKKLQQI